MLARATALAPFFDDNGPRPTVNAALSTHMGPAHVAGGVAIACLCVVIFNGFGFVLSVFLSGVVFVVLAVALQATKSVSPRQTLPDRSDGATKEGRKALDAVRKQAAFCGLSRL